MAYGHESVPDHITSPVPAVPEGSFESVQKGIQDEIAIQRSRPGAPRQGLGVLQEYPVYRAAANGVLEVLRERQVQGAAELITKLAEAAEADTVTDLFSVAYAEKHLTSLSLAAAVTAHAIAAVELQHRGADWGIARAHNELDKPETEMQVGTVAAHTLNTLLSDLEATR